MVWWVVAGVVVVALVALAWRSSGRMQGKSGRSGVDFRNDAQAKVLDKRPDNTGGSNIGGLGGGGG